MHWTGRALAEAETSTAVRFVTLTYGGGYDNSQAYLLEYSDVQKFLKKLRKAGYQFRHMTVGEYGERGRAHWHMILFFDGKSPDQNGDVILQDPRKDKDRHVQGAWDLGISVWERPRSKQASIAYVFKYVAKNVGLTDEGKMRTSQNLGGRWIERYAYEKGKAGHSMGKSIHWSIPGNTSRVNVGNNGHKGLFVYYLPRKSPLAKRAAYAYMAGYVRHHSRKIDPGEAIRHFVHEAVNKWDVAPDVARYLELYGHEEPDTWLDDQREAARATARKDAKSEVLQRPSPQLVGEMKHSFDAEALAQFAPLGEPSQTSKQGNSETRRPRSPP